MRYELQALVDEIVDLMKEKKFEEAQVILEQAIIENESESALHALLGKVCHELDNFEESIRHLLIATEMAPQYHYYWNWLGVSLLRAKHLEDAEAAQRRALEIEPNDFPALMGLGLVLSHMGRNEEAEEEYLKANIQKPNDPHCLSLLGTLAMAKGRYSEAEGWIRKALEADPNHILSRGLLSVVLELMNRKDEHQEEWDKFERPLGKDSKKE